MQELILPIVLALIQREPQIQAALVKLFNGTQPTPDDWQAAHDSAAAETFESLAPNAAANLPAESVTAPGEVTPPVTDQAETVASQQPPVTDQAETVASQQPPVTDQAPPLAEPVAEPFLHPIYKTPV